MAQILYTIAESNDKSEFLQCKEIVEIRPAEYGFMV